jgi:hypothetical protein
VGFVRDERAEILDRLGDLPAPMNTEATRLATAVAKTWLAKILQMTKALEKHVLTADAHVLSNPPTSDGTFSFGTETPDIWPAGVTTIAIGYRLDLNTLPKLEQAIRNHQAAKRKLRDFEQRMGKRK